MKRNFQWAEIDPPNGDEPSSDTRYFQRVIKLPITHWNDGVRAIINRWVERNAWNHSWGREGHCGHEHDCCGCQFAQSAKWVYSFGKLTLTVTAHYNY